MKYFDILVKTNLEVRELQRGEDLDLFIQTFGIPLHLEMSHPTFSRIQFSNPRAILLRLSPSSRLVTCHILKDSDLLSSFANFEIKVPIEEIVVDKKKHCIELTFK